MNSDEQGSDDGEITAHLDRGWDLVMKGDLAGADLCAKQLLEMAADSPDAYTLLGTIATTRGQFEVALAHYKHAMAIDPEFVDPVLYAAELQLGPNGDPDEALRLCEQALEIAEEEEEVLDALLLKAEVEVLFGELEDAAETLDELPPTEFPAPHFHLRAGRVFVEIEDLHEAERHANLALAREPDMSHAHHLLGLIYEARGDEKKAITEFLKVRDADLKEPPAWFALSTERFEKLIEETLAEMPARMRELLANVPIVVADRPTVAMVEDGADPRLMGLFAGTPLPEQSSVGGVGGDAPHLEHIYLFQNNIERACRNADELEEEIHRTVIHEAGHFFGLTEDELEKMGLD